MIASNLQTSQGEEVMMECGHLNNNIEINGYRLWFKLNHISWYLSFYEKLIYSIALKDIMP